jgi:phage baseplate assembly protein V
MSLARLNELERRLSMVARAGTVTAVDYTAARVKVQVGGNVTPWIPWETANASGVRRWNPPQMGEQRIVHAPAGDLAAAYCGGSLFQTSAPANGTKGTVIRDDLPGGGSIEYDTDARTLKTDLTATGSATVTTGNTTVKQAQDSIKASTSGANVELSAASAKLTVGGASLEIKDGQITLTVGGVTATLSASGLAIAGGDVKADSVSLKTHTHTGVQAGTSTTGTPVP